MSDLPYNLAISLAKPVVRGHLSPHEARCAIANHVAKTERAGRLDYDPHHVIQFSRFLLANQIKRLETKRSLTALHIVRRIKPLIETKRPRNVVAAEAHDVNGAEGFPFAEPEVAGIVDREYWFAGRSQR